MTTDGSLQGTRVLVAHASDDARHAVCRVLEGVGAIVAEAASHDEVLAVARGRVADVLLLDAALGCAVAEVKGDPDLFRIAAVLVGGPPDVRATVEALEHGAHDVLREDAPAAEVVARVRAARPPRRCRTSCSRASTTSRRWPITTSSRASPTAASSCASCTRC